MVSLGCVVAGAAAAAETCAPVLARVVSVQGQVDLIRNNAALPAELHADLCAGDQLAVRDRSRAAVLLRNDTTVRLDQGTTLALAAPTAQNDSFLQMCSGVIYVITRTPRKMRLTTPFVNANVEGTEFVVAVDTPIAPGACSADTAPPNADAAGPGGTRVTVLEGRVLASNALGETSLADGQEAFTPAGAPPGGPLTVRAVNAAAWALYVPSILTLQLDAGAAPAPLAAAQIGDPYRSGRVAASLAELERRPGADTAPVRVERAGLLMLLGRLDDARRLLGATLADVADAGHRVASDAHALAAIGALVENHRAEALDQARAAVQLDPASPAAWMALSYVQQAGFELGDALESALRADAASSPATVTTAGREQPHPSRALALARVAELHLAGGDLRASMRAAQSALEANPQLARTQTVFGFARLLEHATRAARQAFATAIELDQADPLPRLGLGLARIRDGDLEAGRADIEVAASLDPGNAMVRSYLGKAYFEEGRDRLAGTQFELAKRADPNDPTPYLYQAILEQTANRPVEALRELQQSIESNDNRAVYRSRMLLDQDRATRQVNLASVYSELASQREAVALSSESVNDDPSNPSAHRFLSESYASRERHDIARTSELLQAQLLQPLSLNPTAPELPFTDLNLPGGSAQAVFSSEATSVFERNRVQALVGGLAGNLGTTGSRLLVSGLFGPVSASIGHFGYSTDGFRRNADITHRIWNAFVQVAASPFLSLQAEYRLRRTNQGDVAMAFDPAFFAPRDRSQIDQRSTRIGATFRPTPESTLIASAVRSHGRFDDRFFADGFVDGRFLFDDAATLYELQYQVRAAHANVVAGAGRSRIDARTTLNLDFTPLLGVPCGAAFEPCDSAERSRVKQWNGYVYVHLRPLPRLSATLGLSRDTYADGAVLVKKWNPKLGLRFAPDRNVTLRAATFGTVKRSLVTQQTIEPTQLVGFNQFYDDVVGSISRFHVAAVDVQASAATTWGGEVGRQVARVGTGSANPGFAAIPEQTLRTEWLRVDATSRASSRLVVALGAATERFAWNPTVPTDQPTYVLTTKVPLTLRTFTPGGYFGEVVTTGVWQRVRRLDSAPSLSLSGSERFVVVDASVGYRLPARRGTLSLDIKNLFGSRFSYQDDDFRSTESRLAPYLPVRRLWLKASLAF